MVDDESSGAAEAPGAQPGAVTVAGHDEDVDTFRHRAHDLAFGAPMQPELRGVGVAEALGRRSKQLHGLVVGDVLVAAIGVSAGKAAPEEADRGCIRSLGDVRVSDVEQREIRVRGKVLRGGIDATLPGAFDHPDDNAHGRH